MEQLKQIIKESGCNATIDKTYEPLFCTVSSRDHLSINILKYLEQNYRVLKTTAYTIIFTYKK